MWKNVKNLDKYQYAKTNPYIVRTIGVLGVLATLLMGYGFLQYLQLSWLYLFFFGPIIFIFITNKLLRYTIQLFYQKFDINKHKQFIQKFWQEHTAPSVDIFLPYAGESIHIHKKVVEAVSQLNYPNYNVYMLDDKGSNEHKKLAQKYGFTYLSRPNRGEHKKSGNLQYAYDHSDSEFVFILDADFIPIKDALTDIIPYIITDHNIGILQTPQYFEQTQALHKKSQIEFGGGNIVEDFYKIIMPCRDEFKAAMCVGTSAIYRRSAIEKLQGTPKVHASEDLATGLLITKFGYYVKYLPLIVSIGKSPDTFQGYFKQHMRWCSGNLIFARYWPKARLSFMARLIYLVNPMYYISEALAIIFSFQFLILLYFHSDSLSIFQTLYFLPYIVISRIIVPLHKTNKNKHGTRLAALNNAYTYFYTYISLLRKNIPSWQPTGAKVVGIHKDFLSAINIGMSISSLYIFLFLCILLAKPFLFGNYNTYMVLGWSFYLIFWHTIYLSSVLGYISSIKLAYARTATEKVFIYTKTHFNFVLFFIVTGVVLFNSVATAFDPNTQTALAIKNMLNKDAQSIVAIATPDNTHNKEIAILGIESTSEKEVRGYSFIVRQGEYMYLLIKRAVALFARDNDLVLTTEQADYAINVILFQVGYNKIIYTGDEVTFKSDVLLSAVEQASNSIH